MDTPPCCNSNNSADVTQRIDVAINLSNMQKTAVEFVTVSDNDLGQRIDNYLMKHLKGVPRSRIYRLCRRGEVRVNKKRVKPAYKLQSGDVVRLPPVRRIQEQEKRKISDNYIDILLDNFIYENDELLVLNKPAGVAVHGGSGIAAGVIEALRTRDKYSTFLELAHRLDRQTSGCLLLCKSRPVLTEIQRQIADREVHKQYTCLVNGDWPENLETVTSRLSRKRTCVGGSVRSGSETGKTAISQFSISRRFVDATLLDVKIETGRTHQIRVHCADQMHPIAGDEKYGDFKRNREWRRLGLKHMFLHASEIEITLGGEQRRFVAPLPDELDVVLRRMNG